MIRQCQNSKLLYYYTTVLLFYSLFQINFNQKLETMYWTQQPINQNTIYHNQYEKVSLSKLAQIKVPFNHNNNLLNSYDCQNKSPKSHIVFIDDEEQNFRHQSVVQSHSPDFKGKVKSYKRKKIFDNSPKAADINYVNFPTFSKIAETNNHKNVEQCQQNTQYYSMCSDFQQFGSKRQQLIEKTQKRQAEKAYMPQTLIKANEQILKNIPLLEQKIQNHEGELKKIKKYLKVNQSIVLFQNQKLAEQNQRLNIQKQRIQLQRIAQSRLRFQKLNQMQRDQTLDKIQRQRTSRIQKIQKENQRLKQALSFQQLQNQENDLNWSKSYPFQNQHLKEEKQMHFRKKSKNIQDESNLYWKSYPTQSPKNRNVSHEKITFNRQKQLIEHKFSSQNISSVNRGFDSFSLDNNTTFRDILSPLDLQKQNQSFW